MLVRQQESGTWLFVYDAAIGGLLACPLTACLSLMWVPRLSGVHIGRQSVDAPCLMVERCRRARARPAQMASQDEPVTGATLMRAGLVGGADLTELHVAVAV